VTATEGFVTLRDAVHAIVSGTEHDEDRFSRVAEAALPYLRQYTALRTRRLPGLDVEDVVQDALVRAWRRWDVVEPWALSGWLYRITANVILDHQRHRAMRVRRGEVSWAALRIDDEQSDDRVAWAPIDPQDVEAEAIANIAWEACRARLLPDHAWLAEWAVLGASYEQVARRHGTTVQAVKAKLYRSRVALRRDLGAWA
jgi:RNA polymerase sigma factor (sigma-70 family)